MKIKRVLASFIVLVAGISIAPPVAAAPVEQLKCVETKMGDENYTKLGEEVAINILIASSSDKDAVQDKTYLNISKSILNDCKKAYSWTDDQSSYAHRYALTHSAERFLRHYESLAHLNMRKLEVFLSLKFVLNLPEPTERQFLSLLNVKASDKLEALLVRMYVSFFHEKSKAKKGFISDARYG